MAAGRGEVDLFSIRRPFLANPDPLLQWQRRTQAEARSLWYGFNSTSYSD
jgi:2,4-dienoyl-CoA reductase-like NADH-dependent reductase (Old Yellow Enzyme family)